MTSPNIEAVEKLVQKAWADFINADDDKYFGNRLKMDKQLAVLRKLAADVRATPQAQADLVERRDKQSGAELVERVFSEPVVEQSKRLKVFPRGDAESPAAWITRVRKAAMIDALNTRSLPQAGEGVWCGPDPISRLYAVAEAADPLKLVTVQAGDLRALVAEHRSALPPAGRVEELECLTIADPRGEYARGWNSALKTVRTALNQGDTE